MSYCPLSTLAGCSCVWHTPPCLKALSGTAWCSNTTPRIVTCYNNNWSPWKSCFEKQSSNNTIVFKRLELRSLCPALGKNYS